MPKWNEKEFLKDAEGLDQYGFVSKFYHFIKGLDHFQIRFGEGSIGTFKIYAKNKCLVMGVYSDGRFWPYFKELSKTTELDYRTCLTKIHKIQKKALANKEWLFVIVKNDEEYHSIKECIIQLTQ